MNILKRIHHSPKLRRIAARRKKIEAQLSKLGGEYRKTFKKEAKRLSRKRR